MDVKQGKPKKGRRPSPRLWGMVHGLTDDEWRQIKAFSEVYGKGSQQFRLLEFHRHLDSYDPDLEKETFSGVALTSMRNTARRWLVRTAARLAFYLTELEELTMDVDLLLRWGYHDVAMEHIAEAKQLAAAQEEFAWLARLLKQEIAVIKAVYHGVERTQALEKVAGEAIANARLLVLEAEIEAHEIRYMENIRSKFAETGLIDDQSGGDYFQTKLYQDSMEAWPVSFQIRKLKIDDLNHYFIGHTTDAIQSATQILHLFSRHEVMRRKMADEHGKCLYRLFAYYSEIHDYAGSRRVLMMMRDCEPSTPEKRDIYLSFYIYMLFGIGFIQRDWSLAVEGARQWEEHRNYLESRPSMRMRAVVLLHVAAYYIAIGQNEPAKRLVAQLMGNDAANMYLPYSAMWRIQHLVTLIDDADVRGLESYGTNYKRHLKRHLPAATPAITIVSLLTRPSNLDSKEKLHTMLTELLEVLNTYEQSDEFTYKPFIYPLIRWAESRLQV